MLPYFGWKEVQLKISMFFSYFFHQKVSLQEEFIQRRGKWRIRHLQTVLNQIFASISSEQKCVELCLSKSRESSTCNKKRHWSVPFRPFSATNLTKKTVKRVPSAQWTNLTRFPSKCGMPLARSVLKRKFKIHMIKP